MIGAAVFSTEDVITARRRRLKPVSLVAARHDVVLQTKSGNIKTVNHVFTGESELNGLPSGYVQFIDLALPAGVLHFPHPLLTGDIDIERVPGRRRVVLKVKLRSPAEHHQHDQERN